MSKRNKNARNARQRAANRTNSGTPETGNTVSMTMGSECNGDKASVIGDGTKNREVLVPSKEGGRNPRTGSLSRTVMWRRALKAFWLYNRTPVTILMAIFIVVEGSVLWFYPQQWWKPFLSMLAIMVVIILWKNMKVVVKTLMSFGVSVVMAALAVQSGFAYGGANVASVWGMSVLTGWALIILVSYCYHPVMSRWAMALAGTGVGFAAGYAFMPLGVVAISVSTISFAVLTVLGCMAYEAGMRRLRNAWKPDKYWRDSSYRNVNKAMISLWPTVRKTRMKSMGTWTTGLWYGVNAPCIIMVPLALDESLKVSKLRGLVYHHRSIRANALWLMESLASRVKAPVPVVIFVDVNGKNQDTKGTGEVVSFTLTDSSQSVYAGLIDGSGSVSTIRKALTKVIRRFSGMRYADDQQVKTIEDTISHDYEKHLDKLKRKNRDDMDSGDELVMDEDTHQFMLKNNGNREDSYTASTGGHYDKDPESKHEGNSVKTDTSGGQSGTVTVDERKLNLALDSLLGSGANG